MDSQRVTLITLGVQSLDVSKKFYAKLGWEPHPSSQETVVFYQVHGSVFGFYQIDDLAVDQGRPGAELGKGAITLAQNFPTKEEVDQAYKTAIVAGASALKAPREVFWGGYSGYWADPDGHVWEVAMNPFWPLAPDGALQLPSP